MTAPTQAQGSASPENKPNDKEYNFRQLEAKYQRELAQERAERERLSKELESKSRIQNTEEDDDDQPYVDHKKLRKEQAKFGQEIKQQTQNEIQKAVYSALQDERKQNWLKSNPDFYDVLQHAEKFAQKDPELAETILEMPESFERQKLVYKNIKAFGLHRPEEKVPSIQEKVDANKRSPYYQPSGIGTAPYSNSGDFSKGGQKQAYDKMKELQNRLRIG